MPEISGSTILILGGAGQVGFEIAKKCLEKRPAKIIICALNKEEVESTITELKKIQKNQTKIEGEWGNIFVREELRTKNTEDFTQNPKYYELTVDDIFSELTDEVLTRSTLFQIFKKHKPKIVFDAINTATAFAYQDVYSQALSKDKPNTFRLLAAMELPQLTRHIQILYHSMNTAGTKAYLKIGTTGTGGLGFTLPFTHGEREIPSRLVMDKTATAGAQTMLLSVLARTPGTPQIKEIKVAALIGWKEIRKGEITIKNKPIELYDCPKDKAENVERALKNDNSNGLNKRLTGAWINTGENGAFTREMFTAISAENCMELITPEEIAETAIEEIEEKNSGKETIQGIDRTNLGPTLIGIAKRKEAIEKLDKIETKSKTVSCPTLGPLCSKTLWEATLLKLALKELSGKEKNAENIERKTEEIIEKNQKIRSEIISIGIPILLPNAKLLRGPYIHVPVRITTPITVEHIERWAKKGWVDLRKKNWAHWLNWLEEYNKSNSQIKEQKELDVGEFCGWIFANKLGGLRLKR